MVRVPPYTGCEPSVAWLAAFGVLTACVLHPASAVLNMPTEATTPNSRNLLDFICFPPLMLRTKNTEHETLALT